MKTMKLKLSLCLFVLLAHSPAHAQLNLGRVVSGATKAAQAITLTDAQMAAYVRESIDWMDKHNKVCDDNSPYTQRLKRLTSGLTNVEGIPLNFKVYYVIDVNAFACPDGSVRVFSSLMDIMTDEELLGVIGHELGHVAHKHSKKAFRTALMTDALKDAAGAANGTVAALTDSQLGKLGQSLLDASYSKSQESDADDYGYDFLKRNGKNPWAMALAFEKLQKLEQEQSVKASRMDKMFSSHPDVSKRIKKMTDRAQKDGIARPENK